MKLDGLNSSPRTARMFQLREKMEAVKSSERLVPTY
jgi:hypothetical protein